MLKNYSYQQDRRGRVHFKCATCSRTSLILGATCTTCKTPRLTPDKNIEKKSKKADV